MIASNFKNSPNKTIYKIWGSCYLTYFNIYNTFQADTLKSINVYIYLHYLKYFLREWWKKVDMKLFEIWKQKFENRSLWYTAKLHKKRLLNRQNYMKVVLNRLGSTDDDISGRLYALNLCVVDSSKTKICQNDKIRLQTIKIATILC